MKKITLIIGAVCIVLLIGVFGVWLPLHKKTLNKAGQSLDSEVITVSEDEVTEEEEETEAEIEESVIDSSEEEQLLREYMAESLFPTLGVSSREAVGGKAANDWFEEPVPWLDIDAVNGIVTSYIGDMDACGSPELVLFYFFEEGNSQEETESSPYEGRQSRFAYSVYKVDKGAVVQTDYGDLYCLKTIPNMYGYSFTPYLIDKNCSVLSMTISVVVDDFHNQCFLLEQREDLGLGDTAVGDFHHAAVLRMQDGVLIPAYMFDYNGDTEGGDSLVCADFKDKEPVIVNKYLYYEMVDIDTDGRTFSRDVYNAWRTFMDERGLSYAKTVTCSLEDVEHSSTESLLGDDLESALLGKWEITYDNYMDLNFSYICCDRDKYQLMEKEQREPLNQEGGGNGKPEISLDQVSNEEIVGSWKMNTEMTVEKNDKSLFEVFGSGISYGSGITFEKDNTFSWWIAIGHGGTGSYSVHGSAVDIQYTPYEDIYSAVPEKTLTIEYVNGVEYLIMDVGDEVEPEHYYIYWTK